MKFWNPAIIAVAGGVAEPTVFTLTLDNLSTRFAEYNGAAASIKFKLTATNGGGALTTSSFVYLDSSQGTGSAANALDAIGDVATLIQTQLNALAGYSGVTVNGVATVPGDQWDFTITFPVVLGVTNLAFHASSQWYPTITLVEAATQQGVAPVQETVRIDYDGVSDSGETILDIGGSITVASGLVVSYTPPSGWSHSAGGDPTDAFVRFSKDDAGATTDPTISSGPGVLTTPTQGVTGQLEIHTITPTPANPTGGSWKPVSDGSTIAYNANTAAIEAGFVGSGGAFQSPTVSGTLNAGAVTVTNLTGNNLPDDALAPINVSLTAPEITHSIS